MKFRNPALFVFFLVLALMASLLLASAASAQVYGPALPGVTVTQLGPYGQGGLGVAYHYAPQIIYRPRTVYQPYVYRGSTYTPRVYHTPLRNSLFGRGTYRSYYSPMTIGSR